MFPILKIFAFIDAFLLQDKLFIKEFQKGKINVKLLEIANFFAKIKKKVEPN